ncbi:DUF167 domain-containing protein [Magnetospirillum moscoviense]|uniref:UPF0235 protein A6A05_01900 n=1 Tax=Magnetospirillum moscoviense TaxID=1437059 RepID=A0A178MMJ8_9PROT|nr:DUF167 domain-containing protein [Magnetospirillum moscoviense]OAN49990.1 hypothetical protein A6A05_01900 [Magnetospirillum moscoviense]
MTGGPVTKVDATGGPVTVVAGGVRVAIRLTPKASRDRVEQVVADACGNQALKATVTAVPEDGKANQALLKMLSKEWKVPKSTMEIVQGATDRRKVVFISGDAAELADRLDQWMAKRS